MERMLYSIESLSSKLKVLQNAINDLTALYNEIIDESIADPQTYKRITKRGGYKESPNKRELEAQVRSCIVKILQERNITMSAGEITGQMKRKYPNVIPLQIINVESFIRTRIQSACKQGVIIKTIKEGSGKTCYGLKYWTDENGNVLTKYR